MLGSAPLPEALRSRPPLADQNALERAEGMLVRTAGPLTVQQNHFLGRYGLLTLAAGGSGSARQPPSAGSAEARALALENARRRILLDDASSRQKSERVPFWGWTIPCGPAIAPDALLGVVDYGLSSHDLAGPAGYRIQPLETALPAQQSAPLASARSGGELRVASFNLLNYYYPGSARGAVLAGSAGAPAARGPLAASAGARAVRLNSSVSKPSWWRR